MEELVLMVLMPLVVNAHVSGLDSSVRFPNKFVEGPSRGWMEASAI